MSAPLLVSVCTLLFCVLAFLYFRAYIAKRTSFDGVLKTVRDEVNRLLLRIDEITEKDISLIEDKEKQLKAFLEETDRRMAMYSRELTRRDNAEKTYRELGKQLPVLELLKHSEPVAAAPVQTTAAALEANTAPPVPIEEQIRELIRSGFSATAIASRLGISIAEAELAVALEDRRKGELDT